MDGATLTVLLVQAFGFLGVVVTQVVQLMMARLNAKALEAKVEATAQTLALQTERTNVSMRETMDHNANIAADHRNRLEQLGRETVKEARRAYTEANTVNNKIASIGLQVADRSPLSPHEAIPGPIYKEPYKKQRRKPPMKPKPKPIPPKTKPRPAKRKR